MFYAVRCVIYNIYISSANRNTQSCSFKLMLLLCIVNAVAVFNADIFASDIYILARNNSTAFNVRSLICIQVTLPLTLPTVLPTCSVFWLAYWSFCFSLPMVKPKPPPANTPLFLTDFMYSLSLVCSALPIFRLPPVFTLTSLSATTLLPVIFVSFLLLIAISQAETLLPTTVFCLL